MIALNGLIISKQDALKHADTPSIIVLVIMNVSCAIRYILSAPYALIISLKHLTIMNWGGFQIIEKNSLRQLGSSIWLNWAIGGKNSAQSLISFSRRSSR